MKTHSLLAINMFGMQCDLYLEVSSRDHLDASDEHGHLQDEILFKGA